MTDYISKIQNVMSEELADSDHIKLLDVHINKDKSVSIALKSVLIAKIHFRVKSSSFMEIDNKYTNIFPAEDILSVGEHWCKIRLTDKEDIFNYKKQLVVIYNDLFDAICGEQFGCCSRYEKCSDAKKCIHPDPAFAVSCMYRKNLQAGKIFYGKNRNL